MFGGFAYSSILQGPHPKDWLQLTSTINYDYANVTCNTLWLKFNQLVLASTKPKGKFRFWLNPHILQDWNFYLKLLYFNRIE